MRRKRVLSNPRPRIRIAVMLESILMLYLISGLIILILAFYLLIQGAIYVPSKETAVETMLSMSKIRKGERAADLGSGDGRIVIEFAKKGFSADGFEINPLLYRNSKARIERLGLGKRAKVFYRSFWGADLSKYQVVTVFGIDYIMGRLERKLYRELKPGSRILVNIFPLPNKKYRIKKNGVYLYQV